MYLLATAVKYSTDGVSLDLQDTGSPRNRNICMNRNYV